MVASYRPVIWRFSGAVERVVLAGEHTNANASRPEERPLIGASGIPADRIVFLGQPGCMTFNAGPSVVSWQAPAEAVRRKLGREPILIKPRERSVAKGAFDPEILAFRPEGVTTIDPQAVVASRPVEPYEVLPEGAGLRQLEQAGAISRRGSREFLVHGKIRFPAGLHGGHLVMFRLQKGAPMPEGDPGHSCVFSEETGLALYNSAMCRQFADKP